MIRNAYPYIPVLRALGDFNLPLTEMFKKVGMPTQLDHGVMNLDGDFNRYIEITYIFVKGEQYVNGVIWDYFLRLNSQGEVVTASEGKTTFINQLDVEGEQKELAGSYEVYLHALFRKRTGSRKGKFDPEDMALFIRETEDLFEYPDGYVHLFRG